MKSSQAFSALLKERGHSRQLATRGERVFSALFPNRGVGFPGGWQSDRLEQTAHLRNWTYVVVTAIMRKIGQHLPNIAYIRNQRIPGKTQKFHKALSVVKPHEELEPVESDHLLRRLIENPNPVDTSFDLLSESQMFLELCGVNYLWAIPNSFGVPCELWTIPAHWVWPRTGGGGYVNPDNPHAEQLIQYYEIRPWGGLGSAGMLRFPPEEVIMERWKSPLNKIDGYSPLSAIAQWIDTEESISKSRFYQFINQARPELWIELGEGYEDANDDKVKRVEAKFASKYLGESNYGRPILTPPGSKLTPLSFNPTEMAYFSSEEQVRDMILSAFQTPGAVVGLSKDMTFGALLGALGAWCSFAINPRLVMRGLTWTKHLACKFSTPEHPIRIWWDDTSPNDPAQVNADLAADASQGSITPNEIRALRGRKPYANGGDDPLMPGPGGTVPLPLNTGDDLTSLAKLVPALGQQQPPPGEGQPGQEGAPGSEGGQVGGPASPPGTAQQGGGEEGTLPTNAGVKKPNGPPSKKALSWNGVVTKTDGPHSFSSSQINLVGKLSDKILAFGQQIPDEDLAGDGREDTGHITLKYGLHTEDAGEVVWALRSATPFTVRLGSTSCFYASEATAQRGGEQYDVVKVNVDSEELHSLNALLSASLEHTDTHPTYQPHITIAYVQPGLGQKYAGRHDFSGQEVRVEEVVFTTPKGKKTIIPLGMREQEVLELVQKGGTCKPGQRADITHCTPANGQSSGNGQSNGKPKPSVNKTPFTSLAAAGSKSFKAVAQACGTVGHAEHIAKEWVSSNAAKNVSRLPPALQKMVRGAWTLARIGTKAIFVTYTASQVLAEKMAKHRGATPEQAARLRATLSTIDVLTFKPLMIGLEMTAGAAVAGGVSFVPLGSAAYLAATGAQETAKLAKKYVQAALKKIGITKSQESGYGLLDQVADFVSESDWNMALFLHALDEAQDVAQALQAAVEAAKEPQPTQTITPSNRLKKVLKAKR